MISYALIIEWIMKEMVKFIPRSSRIMSKDIFKSKSVNDTNLMNHAPLFIY